MARYLDQTGLQDYTTKLTTKYKTVFATKNEVGSPLVAATASAMTDTTKVYVYVGSETGYTSGNWYYYNGSAWTSGGVYNSIAVETDTTLSVPGMPADAKATGDTVGDLRDAIAPAFSSTVNYKMGERVLKDGKLYIFSVDHSAGAWNNGQVVLVSVENALSAFTIDNYVNGGALRNFYIKKADGSASFVSNGSRKSTGYIPCLPGETYSYLGENNHASVAGIAFYTKDLDFISADANLGVLGEYSQVTAPNNAYYLRLGTTKTIGYKIGLICESTNINITRDFQQRLFALENEYVFVSPNGNNTTGRGTKEAPYRTINKALDTGKRKIVAEPGLYNETVSINGGEFELIPWVDDQAYDDSSAPFRPKIKLIKGTKLTFTESGTTGIYQASYTAVSGTNIYKVFVDHTMTPTTSGSLALEYNAMLVGDMPNTSTAIKAFSPYRQQLFTPVLTEEELSAEGTFWYDNTNHLIKFHVLNDTADGEYYVPDDDADTGIALSEMDKVHLEDVKVLGFYSNCININKCDDVTINACEVGYCAKGMGLKLDYANARVSDCHAYAISVDGFNLHGYGYSEIVGCTAFYCGDDGISHHEGCSGFIDGGEWAYNGSGGITPSYGSQIDVRNASAHHNGVGIQWLGKPAQSRYTKMCNCLAVDNTTDIYNRWYVVEAWNNIFRTKDSQYNSARSKLIEYGTITPE